MKRGSFAVLVLSVLATACEPAAPVAPAVSPAPAKEAEPHGVTTREGAVGTYVSIPWGFSTSSYWIEGPDGLVAIDTQFLPSAAEEMIAQAEAMTKKKFVMAIVLHPNPDKFNGTATFQKHGAKVVTSAEVAAEIPAVHASRLKSFYDRYEPDYPKERPLPDVFGDKTMDVTAAGVTLKLHVLGAGCSEAHVVAQYGDQIFPGDLVANKSHSWLEIGKTDAWLDRLHELRAMKPGVVHPGRGASGSALLLDEEERYLKTAIALTAAERPVLPIPKDGLDRVEAGMLAAYPGYDFAVFLKIGLPAEWARQAKK